MILSKHSSSEKDNQGHKRVVPKQSKNLAGKHQILQLCVQNLSGASKVIVWVPFL